ncbi:hypothetical protein [Streptomyces violaceusniger]|uniref:Uncharacterized protein n=1 Tax=Streptomyces violaceusniger TaxID=68280 RepID=A0A4D4LFU7_STRVO|nr:hypothetical protein SVIO_087490 [Streptomyces violaceusniger]
MSRPASVSVTPSHGRHAAALGQADGSITGGIHFHGARTRLVTVANRLPEATVLRLAEPVGRVPAPLAAPDAVRDHTLRVEATVPGTPMFDLDADAVVDV